ncbi:MAG: HD domain-containing protein [Acidobacteriota bacterium]|nr:HD domain-containing protein [Pyrinomonadaceae bacterium]MDW8304411.1 HD domain-containing protein [Acidobacteriota bacterium]
MKLAKKKISLSYLVLAILFLVGLLPLLLTGWFLSERSARELRASESRYQIQLVQDKARQIEMLGQKNFDLIVGIARAFEFSDEPDLSSKTLQERLKQLLSENPFLLAISIRPVLGEPLSVYRAETIKQPELDRLCSTVLAELGRKNFAIGQPQHLQNDDEIVIPIAVPIFDESEIKAAVVGIFSLKEIASIMSEIPRMSEHELWQAGLPMVFVVDERGRAVYHQDREVVANQKLLSSLKIVQEWKASSRQIRSALFPFTAEYQGTTYEMIGAYSTASFADEIYFGVIAMQDEKKALSSVGEMRLQTWTISLVFAVLALIVGTIFVRQLTKPIFSLEKAASKIAEGDLSARIKLNSFKELETLGETFNLMSDRLQDHIERLARAAQENRELFVGTVKALAAAIDGKDKYTRGHSERVARFSVAIGRYLGLDEEELEKLRISALLHDVGKIAIDDKILKKPAPLTEEEYEIMKTHPQKGYKIMSQIPAMRDFLPGMYMHHEMVNGQGYPQGLKGDEIPLQAKIISVADTFDAMTTDRPYQKGMQMEEALNIIKSYVGTRYDGKVVEALVRACAEGKIRPVSAGHPSRHPKLEQSVETED